MKTAARLSKVANTAITISVGNVLLRSPIESTAEAEDAYVTTVNFEARELRRPAELLEPGTQAMIDTPRALPQRSAPWRPGQAH